MSKPSAHAHSDDAHSDDARIQRPIDNLLALTEEQHAACSRDQAHRLHVSNKMLRTAVDRGRLIRVLPDVFRVPGYPSTFEQRLLIGILGARQGDRCRASRRSAAALQQLDGFKPDVAEITLGEARRDYRPGGVTVHSTSLWLPEDLAVVNGVPTTDVVRTIIDLAGCVDRRRLTRIIDAAERDSKLNRDELDDRLERIRQCGRNGVGILARELATRPAPGRNPTTTLERDFMDLLVRYAFPSPDCQVKILLPNGNVAIVDFAWLELMLIVETDGHLAHATREQRAHDAARRRQLTRLGFEVQHFTWEQVNHEAPRTASDLRAAMHDRERQVRDGRIRLDVDRIASWRRGDIV
jgi:very-short-patch-repair endonuclease/predicted transcriptional regulator of viral defense system